MGGECREPNQLAPSCHPGRTTPSYYAYQCLTKLHLRVNGLEVVGSGLGQYACTGSYNVPPLALSMGQSLP